MSTRVKAITDFRMHSKSHFNAISDRSSVAFFTVDFNCEKVRCHACMRTLPLVHTRLFIFWRLLHSLRWRSASTRCAVFGNTICWGMWFIYRVHLGCLLWLPYGRRGWVSKSFSDMGISRARMYALKNSNCRFNGNPCLPDWQNGRSRHGQETVEHRCRWTGTGLMRGFSMLYFPNQPRQQPTRSKISSCTKADQPAQSLKFQSTDALT